MGPHIAFNELVEAVENLPEEAQVELVEVIRLRLAERGRQRVARDVEQARKEFTEGSCSETNPDELMREIER